MMNKTVDRRAAGRTMVVISVFCALAYVCQFVFRIHVMFLTFDAKDAVMAIGAMIFGPLWGLVMSLLVAFLEMITVSDTLYYGFIMNFLSSATFTVLAAWIYRYKRTLIGAILGLLAGVLGMTAVMMLFNLIITPIYLGWPIGDVAALIPTLLLPFNIVKGLFNAGLVLVLYKPISVALKKARAIKGDIGTFVFDRRSVAVLVAGLLLIAVCVILFLTVMGGSVGGGALDKAT